MGYQCSFDPGHGPALLVVTYLETGDTVSPCSECTPPMIATMAGAMGYTVTDAPPPEPAPPPAAPDGQKPARKRPGKAAGRAAAGRTGPAPATDTATGEGAGADVAGDGPDSGPADPGGGGGTDARPAPLNPGAAHQALQEVTGGIA